VRSGLYEYAVVDAGLLDASPVVRVKRPKVSDHSTTVGLDETGTGELLEAADVDGLRFRPRSSRCSPSTVYASTRRCPETSNI